MALALSAVLVACAASEGASPGGGGGAGDDGRCGDASGVPCAPGGACSSDADCEAECRGGVCTAPTHTDGKRSPSIGETGVDCGGPSAPKCGDGGGCALDTDCESAVCGASKTCVLARSCRGASGPAGVDTCGPGEPGEPGARAESCCRSLALPRRTTRRLDRYEITAGRLRAFIEALAAEGGGVPNVRAFAKAQAAANPASQLGVVAASAPGLLDVLPDHAGTAPPVPLPVHLGAFPLDPMNALDGCFVGPGAFGHATYWQPPEDLAPLGIGYPSASPDGVRKYPRSVLDAKPVNCVMPLMLAAFCAWDGGELARTEDYREVWGRRPHAVGAQTVFVPWSELQPIGKFNWRNGHGAACPLPWPGCVNPQPYHFVSPSAGFTPGDDDTPAIGAPGRFVDDITALTSANGEGWLDIGGNLMEAAWPIGAVSTGPSPIADVCDVSASPGPGETGCSRRGRAGVRRYAGALPHVALVGFSFEGHARRSEAFLASQTFDESLLVPADLKPVTFQYGKVGGRCARPGR